MKVNISYAVDIEHVPSEINKLLGECEQTFREVHGDLDRMIGKDPMSIKESIEGIRTQLANLDLRLSDCSNILSGYISIKAGQSKEAPADENI